MPDEFESISQTVCVGKDFEPLLPIKQYGCVFLTTLRAVNQVKNALVKD